MDETILITHCTLLKEGPHLLQDGFILVKNGLIADTGAMKTLESPPEGIVINGNGKLAIPGLINGHNHSPMTLFRGMADDLPLHDWLHNHIFPAESQFVSEEMVYWCSKLAAIEMIMSGTTCVADGYFHSDQTATAFEEAGLRAVVAHGILDFPAPGVPDPSKNIEVVERFIQKWRNMSQLITPGVFAHSPYTCSAGTLKRAKKLADTYDVRFFIHLAEMEDEKNMLLDPAGATPAQHLKNLGILDENCVLIHSIWLTDEDIEIIHDSSCSVVTCPQSNYKLASGVIRAQEMSEIGIPVGLGTDGCASNNSLDMFREMDIYAKSQKVFNSDPTVFSAEKVFDAATEINNRVLNLQGDYSIKENCRADIVLIDLQKPHLTPFYNQDILVYGVRGSDVDTVIINGKPVLRDKKITTCDTAEIMDKVLEFANRLKNDVHFKNN